MQTLLRILRFARPLRGVIPIYTALIILATIFSVINLTVLIPLLQILFDQVDVAEYSELPEFALTTDYFKSLFYTKLIALREAKGKMGALYFLCGFIAISVLLANIFRYFSQLILAKVRVRVIRNLRTAAFQSVLNLDLAFFTNFRKGDTISRITTDIQDVEQSVVSSLKVLIKEPFLIIGYLGALVTISLELTVYTLLLIPAAGFGVSLVARRIRKWATKSQESMGRITQTLDETFGGMRVIKAFNAVTTIRKRFQKEVDSYAQENFEIASKSNLSSPISETVGVVVLVIILIIGGRMVLTGPIELTASSFIGFLVIFSQLLNPAKAISVCMSQVSRGIASAKRVFEMMDNRPDIVEVEKPVAPKSLSNGIQFQNVSFNYGHEEVISTINFELRKGETMALIGPSGGGKSTIADLVCRFYDPVKGDIYVDENNLKELSISDWRDMIALVSQEPILFHDTVANNIAFGNPDSSISSIEAAAKSAFAHDFIIELENGYETVIGDRGNKLSGGQKQRITIARALLKDPQLLILDEATSSLDARSEQLVQQALTNLMAGRTTLLIAHRLSTTQHADRILVIDKGKIVEQGTHKVLMEANGLYSQLTRLQSF
ncbi:MAG: ABC transporter ATP-binding protein [Marinoscillum sp.]